MPKIQRILVGVDGSENSLRAAEIAAELASKFSAKVMLLFVVGPSDFPMLEAKEVWWDKGAKIGSNELDKATALMQEKNVPAETLVEFGHPVEHLLKESEKADMIVLGTRGRSALKGLLMGSVSMRVSQQSKVPVLVVP